MDAAPALLSWTEQLATGSPAVDDEHRRLIDLINEVGRLHQCQASVPELRGALQELRGYTVYHFRTEAQLMRRYPVNEANRRAHLAAHRGFVARLDEFEQLVETNGATVVGCLMAFMVKWLVHHVSGVDVRLALAERLVARHDISHLDLLMLWNVGAAYPMIRTHTLLSALFIKINFLSLFLYV